MWELLSLSDFFFYPRLLTLRRICITLAKHYKCGKTSAGKDNVPQTQVKATLSAITVIIVRNETHLSKLPFVITSNITLRLFIQFFLSSTFRLSQKRDYRFNRNESSFHIQLKTSGINISEINNIDAFVSDQWQASAGLCSQLRLDRRIPRVNLFGPKLLLA